MHSFYPRGNSILDMSTRSAKKKEFVPLLFFLLFKGSYIFWGPLKSKVAIHVLAERRSKAKYFGLGIFLKAHFRSTL